MISLFASLALGVVRTFVGTDGCWSTAESWSPQGVPAAGDTALFSASATIGDSFVLPGRVTLETVSDATVTLAGVMAGPGGLVKTGEGELIVSGNNSFAGDFVVSNGCVRARGWNALGDSPGGKVEVVAWNRTVYLHLGGVHVRKDLVLRNCDDSGIGYHGYFLTEANTTNCVSGETSVPGSYLRMSAADNSRIDFVGGGTFGKLTAFLSRSSSAEIRVAGKPMTAGNRYSYSTSGWLTLAVAGNSFVDSSSGTQDCVGSRRLAVDGALSEDSSLNGGKNVKLDLCGTMQRFKRLFGRDPSRPGSVFSARPASLTLTEASAYTNTCVFSGPVALTLTGGSGEVTLTGASTATGTLTVETNKTVRLTRNARWRGGVVVKGRLVVEDAAALSEAAFVDLWGDGSIEGTTGGFRASRRNGVAQDVGVRRTYVGTDGRWTRAANWNPSGVPGAGDTVVFPATATITESFVLPGAPLRIEEEKSVTVTISGVVGGAEATLVHAGAGTLALTSTNTFSGAFSNLTGTVKIPKLAPAGEPSPLGAGSGAFAPIYNKGTLWVTESGTSDRPYVGAGSCQWHVDGETDLNAPVSGSTTLRRAGTVRVNAYCPDLVQFSNIDNGTVELTCPTNDFSANMTFGGGMLGLWRLANGGLPSSAGCGTSFSFGDAAYPKAVTLVYCGDTDVTCDRALDVRACNGSVAQYPSQYARHEGMSLAVRRTGVKATYTGTVTLKNLDAKNPFFCCEGAGDVEVTSALCDRFHLYKKGSGTWTLSGAVASTGTCTVTEGRLDLNGSFAPGLALDVRSGAVFGGTGRVGCAATFGSGVTLAPGTVTEIGTLTFADKLKLTDGCALTIKVGRGGCDCVDARGTLSLPAQQTVTLTALDGGKVPDGDYFVIRWQTMPSTQFALDGAVRGCSLEKRAEGLVLRVGRHEDFFAPLRADGEPYVVEMTSGETLASLQQRVRSLLKAKTPAGRPVTVTLLPGDYVLGSSLSFTTADSGTPAAPVTWRAARRGTVRILGARALDKGVFRNLEEGDPLWLRVSEEARGKILVADVSGRLPATLSVWSRELRTPPAPWLFLGGEFQDEARWPNRTSDASFGWTTFTKCMYAGDADGTGVRFVTKEDRAARWNFGEGVWLYGYWGNTWNETFVKARDWRAGTREMTLDGKPTYVPKLGTQSPGRQYIAVNVPEELDAPGEWWLDRTARRLYYCPPAAFATDELVLTAYTAELLKLSTGVHDLAFENLTFAYADRAFSSSQLKNVSFDGCDFHSLMNGSTLSGSGCAVRRSSFRHLGKGGVTLSGGDRPNLVRALNVAEDCEVCDFEHCQQTYCPAVSVSGCGNAVRRCYLHDSAHEAIGYGGNEHFIGWTEFCHVLRESQDCGAIYTGRDTSQLGTQIVGNRFHSFDTDDVTAIYFDDCDWGDDAVGNSFEGVYRAFLVGGGELHELAWNVMRDCGTGIHFDRRGVTWQPTSEWLHDDDWHLSGFTKAKIDPASARWTAAYPTLVEALNDTPREPWRNVIRGNLLQDCATWTDVRAETVPASSYSAGTNGLTIVGNVTASTKGKAGTNLPGFTHLKRAATADDVPGLAAAQRRIAALDDAPVTEVRSPGGAMRVRVGLDVTARLCCRADWMGKDVLGLSPMGVTVDAVDYGRMVRPVGAIVRTVTDGKAVDETETAGYNELTLTLERVVDGSTAAQVEVRAFADGFAWRMRVAGEGARAVAGEFAQWNEPDETVVSVSAIPTEGWTTTGEVVTPWHVLKGPTPVLEDGTLVIDVASGVTRPLTDGERAALALSSVENVVKTGGGTLELTDTTGYAGVWSVTDGVVAAAPAAFGDLAYLSVSGQGRISVPSGATLACEAVVVNGQALTGGEYADGWVAGGGFVAAGYRETDTFEEVAAGTAAEGLAGWRGEECAVEEMTYDPPLPPGMVLKDMPHTKVLSADDDVGAVRTVQKPMDDGAKMEAMIRVRRAWQALETPDDDVQVEIAVDREGRPCLWHLYEENGVWTRGWTVLSGKPYANGDWMRVGFEFDYAGNSEGDAFVRVRIDGSYRPTARGVRSPTDTRAYGAWHYLAKNRRTGGVSHPTEFGFSGTKVDDFAVSRADTVSDHAGATSAGGIDFAWFDRLGFPRDPAFPAPFIGGYALRDVYAAGVDPYGDRPLQMTDIFLGAERRLQLEFNGYRGDRPTAYRLLRSETPDFADFSVLTDGVFEGDSASGTTIWTGTDPATAPAGFYKVEAQSAQ